MKYPISISLVSINRLIYVFFIVVGEVVDCRSYRWPLLVGRVTYDFWEYNLG